jgi:ATP-dependent DNA helicase PIF1
MSESVRGKRWTSEQDDALWESGAAPGRSDRARRLRQLKLACTRIDAGALSEEEALTHIGASATELAQFRAREETPRAASAAADAASAAAEAATPAAGAPAPPRAARPPKAPAAPPAPPPLTPDQEAALAAAHSGQSILLTGPAGTGKSYAVAAIARDARERHPEPHAVALTAATGTAAMVIGGRTLHSWLGCGRGEGLANMWLESGRGGPGAWRDGPKQARIRAARVLILDEVSMIAADFLDGASAYLSNIREDPAPFGGLQVIFVGDFAQLPPVRGPFAFTAKSWQTLAPVVCQLTTVVRQADPEFQEMLQRLRRGRPLPEDIARLEECRATTFASGITPTRLCALNRDADAINQRELAALLESGAAPVEISTATRGGAAGANWATSAGIPGAFVAAIGAQVMVTRNITDRTGAIELANGTRGVLVAADETTATIRRMDGTVRVLAFARAIDEGNSRNSASFIPLQLAWAISIHRSQGATLDALEVDLGPSVFEAGQAYVAISRARDLASVRITRLDPRVFRCHPAVLAFYDE